MIFKYIPCFYLSVTELKGDLNQLSFKYIPCFYLSITRDHLHHSFFYSNTSHVFIYPSTKQSGALTTSIQIHPMFLFITNEADVVAEGIDIQIHPMFLFI